MKYVWELSEKMAVRNKENQTKYFLLLNIITYCLAALLLSAAVEVLIFHKPVLSIDELSMTMLSLGVIIGLFGGIIFALRKD